MCNIFYKCLFFFGIVKNPDKEKLFFSSKASMGRCHPHLSAMEGNNRSSWRSRDCVFADHKTVVLEQP